MTHYKITYQDYLDSHLCAEEYLAELVDPRVMQLIYQNITAHRLDCTAALATNRRCKRQYIKLKAFL